MPNTKCSEEHHNNVNYLRLSCERRVKEGFDVVWEVLTYYVYNSKQSLRYYESGLKRFIQMLIFLY